MNSRQRAEKVLEPWQKYDKAFLEDTVQMLLFRIQEQIDLAVIQALQENPHVDYSGLNSYMKQVRELTDAKGFSSEKSRVWEMLALIHSEISEAADTYKKGGAILIVGIELADAIICILHLCSALEIDIEECYRAKMAANWARPQKYNTVRGG